MKFESKQISSLYKIRTSEDIPQRELKDTTLLKGESFSYQIGMYSDVNPKFIVSLDSPLSDYITLYATENAPMDYPVNLIWTEPDDNYLTKTPGMMPDILFPISDRDNLFRLSHAGSLWVKINLPKSIEAGTYPITIKFETAPEQENAFAFKKTLSVKVLNETLPDQKIFYTQWFHTDCIASAHNVPVYSVEHWDLIDKYMSLASECGINTILTPVITPPLDTGIGKKRPCVQLVKIKKNGGKYSFDFSLLTRWIDLCHKNNIEYFEISHLFSQWGLKYSPNIKVEENGVEDYMFGWHVLARSDEYKEFLTAFLPELVAFLKAKGIDKKCFFHISDEPILEHLDNYKYAYSLVKPLIGDCRTMDALSDFEFYKEGLVPTPVTASNHIAPFLDKKIEHQWTYYCCAQDEYVSNRFLSMPSYRNRIMGLQLYKYDIEGFLQWGYNFYYSQLSEYEINPYVTTSADRAFPSGDAFSVYPAKDKPVPSLRAYIFKEALQDISLCKLLEKYIGKEAVLKLIEEEAGMEITFTEYPHCDEFLPRLNKKLKDEIEKLSKKA